MNSKEEKSANGSFNSANIYDLSSPRWQRYYRETQKTVKFPRGYKEVSLLQ